MLFDRRRPPGPARGSGSQSVEIQLRNPDGRHGTTATVCNRLCAADGAGAKVATAIIVMITVTYNAYYYGRGRRGSALWAHINVKVTRRTRPFSGP